MEDGRDSGSPGSIALGDEIGEGQPTELAHEGCQEFPFDRPGVSLSRPPRDQELRAVGQLPRCSATPVACISTSTLSDETPHATLEVGSGC